MSLLSFSGSARRLDCPSHMRYCVADELVHLPRVREYEAELVLLEFDEAFASDLEEIQKIAPSLVLGRVHLIRSPPCPRGLPPSISRRGISHRPARGS